MSPLGLLAWMGIASILFVGTGLHAIALAIRRLVKSVEGPE